MIIRIPDNNIEERTYILNVMFRDFIGLDFELSSGSTGNYEICLDNGYSIIIRDDFFNHHKEPLSYLSASHIPEAPKYSENRFTPEKNIPVLYGSTEVNIEDKSIFCGMDVFASSFFMLTRWEEYVIKEKDKHGRVADHLQYAGRYSLNERPVVNEYSQMLSNMLLASGIQIPNKHHFTPFITHDIDFFHRYAKMSNTIKAALGDIFKRKSFRSVVNTIISYFKIRNGKQKDPYDTFDFLMQQSEEAGLKSLFYFIPSYKGEADSHYDIRDKKVIGTMKDIIAKGHRVGVHGAYRSYNDAELYKEEMKRFPDDIAITENRQHYLRFQNPETWQMLDDNGIRTDSTMGYAVNVGFRAGTCFEYPLFNILERKSLTLIERPITVMEQALRKKFAISEEFYEKILELKDTVKKYSGTFVLLWHNTGFNVKEWKAYACQYERLMNNIW